MWSVGAAAAWWPQLALELLSAWPNGSLPARWVVCDEGYGRSTSWLVLCRRPGSEGLKMFLCHAPATQPLCLRSCTSSCCGASWCSKKQPGLTMYRVAEVLDTVLALWRHRLRDVADVGRDPGPPVIARPANAAAARSHERCPLAGTATLTSRLQCEYPGARSVLLATGALRGLRHASDLVPDLARLCTKRFRPPWGRESRPNPVGDGPQAV